MSSFSRESSVVRRWPLPGSSHTPGSRSLCCSSPARARLRSRSKVLLCAGHPAREAVDPIAVLAHPDSGRHSVALLVLLARTARAGGVARDLVPDGRGTGGSGAGRTLITMRQLDPLRPRPGRLVLTHQFDPVDVPDELLLDGRLHLLEHVEGLALVLHQGITLPVGPEPDALLEVVHLVQVLAPLVVDDREQHHPLQLAEDRPFSALVGPELLLLTFVGFERVLKGELQHLLGAVDLLHF